MSFLLKYLLPATLFACFLCSFISEAHYMPVSIDDSFFDAVTHRSGILGGASYCFSVLNGRWFSHLVSCFVFFFAGHHAPAYSIFVYAFCLFFVFCVSFFYKTYCKTFRNQDVSFLRAMLAALLATALLYFLLYPGRREVWFWLSSTANHLLSVSLCVLLIGLMLSKKNFIFSYVLVFLTASCVGGLNEVNAICTTLLMGGIYILLRKTNSPIDLKKPVLAGGAIFISLIVNFTSQGYKTRMDGLPDFTLIQSVKNTFHSFLLPVLQKDLIPVMILVLLGAVYVLKCQLVKEKIPQHSFKKALFAWLFALSLVALSFFLHCYSLSDIVPARGALWGYCLVLFMFLLSLQGPKKKFPMKMPASYKPLIQWLSLLCCALIVSLFFFEPFKFPENGDDIIYINLLKQHAIPEIMRMFPVREGIYLSHFDGRYIGNLISLLVFTVMGSKSSLYFIYELFVFLILVLSVHGLLIRLVKEKFLTLEAGTKKILLSFLTAACLFGLLFDGRFEVFYWISSISNHLASIILFLAALTLFIGRTTFLSTALLLLISFSFGMMNEAYAICFAIVFSLVSFTQKRSVPLAMCMSLAILLSLYLNFSTAGTSSRIHEASKDLSILQAIKDTGYTFLLPIIQIKYWPIKIILLFLFVVTVAGSISLPAMKNDRVLILNRILLVAAILSVLLQCYLLRMECPYRGQIFFHLVMLYFIFLMAALKTINPLKVFFR